MRHPRCNIALKIVSRIAAPTKRSHALRETLRACISSVALADIGGDFSFSRLRSRMACGSNLNTLDIRFLRHVARWTTSSILVFKALPLG